jgi:hypothetical protein
MMNTMMNTSKLLTSLLGILLLFSGSISSDDVIRRRRQKVAVETVDLTKFLLQDDANEIVRVRGSKKNSQNQRRTVNYYPSFNAARMKGKNSVFDTLLMSMDPGAPTKAPTFAPSGAPTNLACMGLSRSEAMLSILSEVTDEQKLLQPNSPQGVAYLWIIDGDQAMVDPCTYPTVKQRFALATFFYSTGGSFWTSETRWLSAANECLWMGVNCDDGDFVTGIRLGTYFKIPCSRLFEEARCTTKSFGSHQQNN